MPSRVILLLLASSASLFAQPVTPLPLVALNDAFRAAYADAKTRVLAASGPTLIANGDVFSLVSNGKRLQANVGTVIYDPVKTISHIPLAIFVALTPGEGALDDDRLKTLTGLRELIPPAAASLETLQLPPATLTRQKKIIAASQALLADVTTARRFERSRLLAFTRSMSPLVMENVTEATRVQLDAIHNCVSAWRRELSAEEWNRLHVVIVGPHMPRDGLVVTQYFLRLLHEHNEGRRVVYAESLWEEPKALDLLGTHVLDGNVGEAFFGDYMRMHRDLLGDAATRYLRRLLPN